LKHYHKGSTSLKSLQMIPPEKKTIDGVVHVCFRDIVHNLLVEQVTGQVVDFKAMEDKIKYKATRPLSPKHRKRIIKQAKRLEGGR
jgi:hypothetical protein